MEITEFNGRRILVTGGTRGIGEAIVNRLIRGGGNVIATARSVSPGTPADRFVQADVSTREGIETVVKAVTDRFQGLDILIHNVGGSAARGGGALAQTLKSFSVYLHPSDNGRILATQALDSVDPFLIPFQNNENVRSVENRKPGRVKCLK